MSMIEIQPGWYVRPDAITAVSTIGSPDSSTVQVFVASSGFSASGPTWVDVTVSDHNGEPMTAARMVAWIDEEMQ